MVTLHRADTARSDEWRVLDEWTMASAPGNERAVMQRVAASVATVRLSARWREQLATAVAEATLNAMEHGNGYHADAPVAITVLTSSQALAVRISDAGRGMALSAVAVPDLAAKLAGGQSPRGWGLFLIQQMVDQVRKLDEPARHTVELLVNYDERGPDDGENA